MNGKNESDKGKAMSHIHHSRRRQEMDSVHQDHHGNLAIQPREETQMFPHQPTRDLSYENYHYRNHYQYTTTNPYHAFNTPQFVNTYQDHNLPMGHVVQPPNYQRLTQYHASNPYAHVSNQNNHVYPHNSKESDEFRLPSDQSSYSNIGPQYHTPCYQNTFLYHSPSPNVFDRTPCYPYHNSFQHQVANEPRTCQHQTTNIGHSFHTPLDTRINQSVHAEHPNHDTRMSNNQLEQDSRYGQTQVYDERLQIRSRTFVTNESQNANEKVVPDEMNEKFQILHKTFLSDSIIGIAITSEENKVMRNWQREYSMGTATSGYNGGEYKQQNRKKSTKYQRLGYYYCKGKRGRNGGCERTYIIVRFHQWLALYSSKVQHIENCNVAPRIKNAPKEMIINAYRNRDHVNPGRTAYNSIDLDKVDSEYPELKIKTGHGKKRAISSINRHMKTSEKQCNNKKRENDYSMDEMMKEVREHLISPTNFSLQNIEDLRKNSKKYKEVVYVGSDINNGEDIMSEGYQYILFTTRGKLEVFKKSIEMANNRGSLTLEVDCSGVKGVCLIVIGISDYAHKFHPLVHGCVKVENGASGTAALGKVLDFFVTCGLDRSKVTTKVLKDGSPSFSLAAKKIGAKELACISHMGRVGTGVGTRGRNSRGSLWTFCRNKNISNENLNHIISMFHCHISLNSYAAYSTNRNLIAREMLVMLKREDSTKITNIPGDPSECLVYINQNYGPFMNKSNQAGQKEQTYLINKSNEDEIMTLSQDGVYVSRKWRELHPLELVIVQLFSFYIPETPVYGPAFEPGAVQVTNGLESNWRGKKNSIRDLHDQGFQHLFRAMKSVAQHETDHQNEESFRVEPVQLKEEFDLILNNYAAKVNANKSTNKATIYAMEGKLPQQYNSVVVYCGASQNIVTKETLQSLIKKELDLVVYLPSRWYVNSLVNTLYKENTFINNKGGCSQQERKKPNNAISTRNFVAQNAGHIRRLVFRQLYDIHPSNIFRNKRDQLTFQVLPEIETMSTFSYTKIHGQRDGGDLRAATRTYQNPNLTKKVLKDKSFEASKNCLGYIQCQTDFETKGKGMFHRLVIRNGQVTCNCENFHRTGLCIDAEIMKLTLLKKYDIDPKLIDWNLGFQGVKDASERLFQRFKDAIISKEILQELQKQKDTRPPPPKDPTTTNPRNSKNGNIRTTDD